METTGILSLSLWVGGIAYCSSSEYSELVTKCKRIRLGDTEKQVLKELGPPSRGRDKFELEGRQCLLLGLSGKIIGVDPCNDLGDAKSDSVVRVTCNDEYQLREKR